MNVTLPNRPQLFERACDPESILKAYIRARKGLAIKSDANVFAERLEHTVLAISQQLRSQTYVFGPYQSIIVRDPKERLIYVAPFPDRVVHHAINSVIEPILDATFIHDSYACRKGRGNLKAIKRLQSWLDRDPHAYVLKMDITKYFASIDRGILIDQVHRKIKDRDLMVTMERLVFSAPCQITEGCGLPIGNLTSQILANVYLNQFDHFVKDYLGIRRYLRYVDDFLCLGPKVELHQLRRVMTEYLARELRLSVSKPKCKILSARNAIPFLGFNIQPNRRPRLRKEALKRFFWSIRCARRQRLSEPEIAQKVASWFGYAKLADVGFLLRSAKAAHYLENLVRPTKNGL